MKHEEMGLILIILIVHCPNKALLSFKTQTEHWRSDAGSIKVLFPTHGGNKTHIKMDIKHFESIATRLENISIKS